VVKAEEAYILSSGGGKEEGKWYEKNREGRRGHEEKLALQKGMIPVVASILGEVWE